MPKLARFRPGAVRTTSREATIAEIDAGRTEFFEQLARGAASAGVAAGGLADAQTEVDKRIENLDIRTQSNLDQIDARIDAAAGKAGEAVATVELEENLANLRQSVSVQGDAETMLEDFDGEADRMVSRILEAHDLPAGNRRDLELRAFQLKSQHRRHVQSQQRTRKIDGARAKLLQTREAMLSAIEREDDPERRQFLRDVYLDSLQTLTDAGAFEREEAAEQSQSFREDADEVVATSLQARRVSTLTSDIMEMRDEDGTRLTKSQAKAVARRIEDPEISELVVKAVDFQKDEEKAAQTAIAREASETAWGQLVAGDPLSSAFTREIPAADVKLMGRFERERAAAAAQGGIFTIETDKALHSTLSDLRDHDPKEFAKVWLPDFRLRLAPPVYEQFREAQATQRSTGNGAPGSSPISGIRARGKEMLERSGVSDPDEQAAYLFDVETKLIGTDLSFEDQDRVMRNQLRELTVNENALWFDDTKRVVEMTAEDRAMVLDEMPEDWRRLATENLEKTGNLKPSADDLKEWVELFLDANGVPDGK